MQEKTKTEDYEEFKNNFRAVLKNLCESRKSISHICYECGINRQQFGKYLNGQSLPSIYTLNAIARYFGVDISIFFNNMNKASSREQSYAGLFDLAKNTSNYMMKDGYFTEYSVSDVFTGKYVVGISKIHHDGAYIRYRRRFPAQIPGSMVKQSWAYDGFVRYTDYGAFIYYLNTSVRGNFGAYLLTRLHIACHDMVGVKVGSTSRPVGLPFSSAVLFHYLGAKPNLRLALRNCGIFDYEEMGPESQALIAMLHTRTEQQNGLITMSM